MDTYALDFDGTFDRMPDVWRRFIQDVKANGHRVFIVSCRRCSCTPAGLCENHVQLKEATGCSVFLTGGSAKEWYMESVAHIAVTHWIDNDVRSITEGT